METHVTRVFRAHRFRLDLNKAEIESLDWFASARCKAWNWALELTKNMLDLDRGADRFRVLDAKGEPYRYLDRFTYIRLFTAVKASLSWTTGVPTRVFEYAFEDLCASMSAFWATRGTSRPAGFPEFIAAHKRETFTTRGSISVTANGRIQLPRLQPMRVCGSTRRMERDIIELHGVIKEATVSYSHGHWWVSIIIERDARRAQRDIVFGVGTSAGSFVSKNATRKKGARTRTSAAGAVGIDVGIHHFLTMSDGTVIENPRFLAHAARNMHRQSKSVGRSQSSRAAIGLAEANAKHAILMEKWELSGQVGDPPLVPDTILPPKSNRHKKKERHLSRAHEKVANCRRSFHQQTAVKIVPAYAIVGMEDLAISNMVLNHKMSRVISDVGWGGFGHALETRAEDYGAIVINAWRFFASSQICSVCGFKNVEVKNLKVRSWTCPVCGTLHNRDANASTNLIPTDESIIEAIAEREKRAAVAARSKEKVAKRARKASATNKLRAAAKLVKKQARLDAVKPASSPLPFKQPRARVPALTGTSVAPIPGSTQNSAWRTRKTALGSALICESRTDLLSEMDVNRESDFCP